MTREMFCLMEGRHVHPSTLYPGGVGTVPTVQLFTDYLVRLMKYVEFMKKCVPLHDDLFDFFYEALPGYEKVGYRRTLLGCWGSFNNPDVCDYTYKNMTNWGDAMFVTPGVVVDGKLVTHDLIKINLNIRILLGHSFYDDWANARDVRQDRPAREPGRSAASLEPDHDSAAAEARLRRQVHLGDVAALVRQRTRTIWRSIPAAARSPGSGRRRSRASWTSATSRRRARASRCTCPRPRRSPRPSSSGRFRSGATRSSGTAPGPTSRYTPPLAPTTSSRRRWPSCMPDAPRPGTSSRCPTRRSAAASTRRCAACCRITS